MERARPTPRAYTCIQVSDTHLPNAECGDRRLDVLHRIVDGEARGDDAAGRVDVHENRLVHGLCFQIQQLRTARAPRHR